jgi:O-methyltransferase involved in polyketide biosynthesis
MSTESNVPAGAKSKIELKGVPETSLVTLYTRQQDFLAPQPLLNDKWAEHVVSQLDYDFSRVSASPITSKTMVLRARQLDRWTADFLAAHESATVLHVACGLDSRAHRVEWGAGVRWIDIDLPDVVELRQKLIPSPEGDYTLVGGSILDDAVLSSIPNDRPTVVVMEGLTMYLQPSEGEDLIRKLCERFPSGDLMFDSTGWIILAMIKWVGWLMPATWVKNTGVQFTWSIDDPKALEKLHDGLKLVEEVLTIENGIDDYPLSDRLSLWGMAWIPGLRYLGRILRYRFP